MPRNRRHICHTCLTIIHFPDSQIELRIDELPRLADPACIRCYWLDRAEGLDQKSGIFSLAAEVARLGRKRKRKVIYKN